MTSTWGYFMGLLEIDFFANWKILPILRDCSPCCVPKVWRFHPLLHGFRPNAQSTYLRRSVCDHKFNFYTEPATDFFSIIFWDIPVWVRHRVGVGSVMAMLPVDVKGGMGGRPVNRTNLANAESNIFIICQINKNFLSQFREPELKFPLYWWMN